MRSLQLTLNNSSIASPRTAIKLANKNKTPKKVRDERLSAERFRKIASKPVEQTFIPVKSRALAREGGQNRAEHNIKACPPQPSPREERGRRVPGFCGAHCEEESVTAHYRSKSTKEAVKRFPPVESDFWSI